ncbi:uncharacterized protein [Bemisia tabaci]|uniref:uncharacterized protein isoform X1 n=1 Tax=Bemisia tabaci TaxID=7038 RepID=UPI003B28B018
MSRRRSQRIIQRVNVANDISNNDSDITHPVNEAENSFIENLETHQSNSKPKKKIKSKSRDLSVNVANDISNNDSDITHPVNEAENSFIENLETHQSNSKPKKKIKSKSRDLSLNIDVENEIISISDSEQSHARNESPSSFIKNAKKSYQSNLKLKRKRKSNSSPISVNLANDISNNYSEITHPVNEAENSFIENLETHQSNSKPKKKIKSKSRDLSVTEEFESNNIPDNNFETSHQKETTSSIKKPTTTYTDTSDSSRKNEEKRWTYEELMDSSNNEKVPIPISEVNNQLGPVGWCIKGTVVKMTNLTTYENPQKKGRYIKFTLQDESGDILITAFNEMASEFDKVVKYGDPYKFQNGMVKFANNKWNQTSHNYEITCTRQSKVSILRPDQLPSGKSDIIYADFTELLNLPEGTEVNVKGQISIVHESERIYSEQKEKSFDKRLIVLKDKEGNTIDIDLWNNSINLVTEKDVKKQLQILNGRTYDYQGHRSISTTNSRVQFTH